MRRVTSSRYNFTKRNLAKLVGVFLSFFRDGNFASNDYSRFQNNRWYADGHMERRCWRGHSAVSYARRAYHRAAHNSRVNIHLSRISHPCVRLLVRDRDVHVGYALRYARESMRTAQRALRATAVCVNACNRRGGARQLASEWQDLKLERLSCVSIVACAYRTPPSGFALFS